VGVIADLAPAQQRAVALAAAASLTAFVGSPVLPPFLTRLLIIGLLAGTPLATFRLASRSRVASPRWLWLFLAFVVAGVAYGAAFFAADVLEPTPSFLILNSPRSIERLEAIWFSFQVLTTTTFGDFLPMTAWPRAIALAELGTSILLLSVALAGFLGRQLEAVPASNAGQTEPDTEGRDREVSAHEQNRRRQRPAAQEDHTEIHLSLPAAVTALSASLALFLTAATLERLRSKFRRRS
jgi:hypothetical protein